MKRFEWRRRLRRARSRARRGLVAGSVEDCAVAIAAAAGPRPRDGDVTLRLPAERAGGGASGAAPERDAQDTGGVGEGEEERGGKEGSGKVGRGGTCKPQ